MIEQNYSQDSIDLETLSFDNFIDNCYFDSKDMATTNVFKNTMKYIPNNETKLFCFV